MASIQIMKHLGAILAFATAAKSQNYSDLCNSSISNANASGILTIPNAYAPWSEDGRNPSWAVTVSGGNGEEVNRNLWYDTAGENYADDMALRYDVCTIVFADLHTNAYLLGQNDSGNCSSMITDRCKESVSHMASISADKWTTYSTPPPYENLTAGVLPTICRNIRDDLQETLEANCSGQLLDQTRRNLVTSALEVGKSQSEAYRGTTTLIVHSHPDLCCSALTGYNDSILYSSNCTLSAGDRTFRPVPIMSVVLDDREAGNDIGYDNATHEINPILTIYMPVANMEREREMYSSLEPAQSVLQCIRASNISEGSRVALDLPEGTPWPSRRNGLTPAAKGGIAAGVVSCALIVGGLGLWLWHVKRKTRAQAAAAVKPQSDTTPNDDEEKKLPPEADGAGGVYELTPDDRKLEIDGVKVLELDSSNKASELADTSGPVELAAESCGAQKA